MPDFSRDGWTVSLYGGEFSPMALGPKNVSLEVNDDGTVTIEHQVPSDYYSRSTITASVTVPLDWLEAMVAATEAWRKAKRTA